MNTLYKTDAAGTLFDPSIHQIRNGKPLLRKKDGCFVLKKGVKNRLNSTGMHEYSTKPRGIVQKSETPAPQAETSNGAAILDGVLDAGTSTPTVPAPGNSVSSEESFMPEDLTFPEENPESAAENSEYTDAINEDPPPVNASACRASAETVVQITEMTAIMFLGDEMKMESAERKNLVDAWDAYFQTSGGVDLPPWATVLVANGLYFGMRATLPTVQARLLAFWDRLNGRQPQPKRTEQPASGQVVNG